jgi:hypothetical protein
MGVLDGIDLYFGAIPAGYVHGTIDIFELDSAICRQRVDVMKLLGKLAFACFLTVCVQ